MHLADKARFYQQKFKKSKSNAAFKLANPSIKLPPDYLIYESHEMDYEKYYNGGLKTAKWLVGHLNKHSELKGKNILDWGCGPGRIIRHFPEIVNNGCSYFGSDYNAKSIAWNKKNLEKITFNHNSLKAILPYNDEFMDVIYALSVFTHLSEKLHYEWFEELYRVLNPGGIMFITTSGENYRSLLSAQELKQFDNNELVARGQVKEGHRIYTTFHPKGFMEKLFNSCEILDHIVEKPVDGWLPQDIWIIKKPV